MRLVLLSLLVACGESHHAFPLREPMVRDTDLDSVSVPCRPDPDPKEPDRKTCAPEEYISPWLWDQVDNIVFGRLSRGFSIATHGESVNVNSLDETPDSSWFTNKPRTPLATRGACSEEDILPTPDKVPDGEWLIDHGKDNGSTLGFRVTIPGRGKYMLKADAKDQPEQASAASAIGAALYVALGYNSTCEQVVYLSKKQLKLKPGLTVTSNSHITTPFDETALDKTLASTTQGKDGLVRMQASKWLEGLPVGPYRYSGTRGDDPNDVIPHEDRRDLRGAKIIAAWLNHWDAREQNSMDVWVADNKAKPRSSPGKVMHYVLDTSDAMGAYGGPYDLAVRFGNSYNLDFPDILRALFTFGLEERPWERATQIPGKEKFGYYATQEFDPEHWKAAYPNPTFLRTTERDAAWAARLLARFSDADLATFVAIGKFSDPTDSELLVKVLHKRLHMILDRFLMRLSPLGEIRQDGDKICATDFARLRELAPAFTYTITERTAGGREATLTPDVGDDGRLCFVPQHLTEGGEQRVAFRITNGTPAAPLVIHAYDVGARGVRIAGVSRPEE